MLLTDLSSDYVRSYFADARQRSWSRILCTVRGDGTRRAGLARPGGRPCGAPALQARARRTLSRSELRGEGRIATGWAPAIFDASSALSRGSHAEYGYSIRERGIEFVSARVQAVGEGPEGAAGADRGRGFARAARHRPAGLSTWTRGAAGAKRRSTSDECLPVGDESPRPCHHQRDERDDGHPRRARAHSAR